ncbi:MAG: peptidylprolyl isomerase [Limisphaerales bacterium]
MNTPSPASPPPRHLAAVLALAALLGVAGCRQETAPSAARPPGADELARVGPAAISVDAFLAERDRQGVPIADAALLDRLVRRELLFAGAQRAGLDRSPALQAAWKNLVAQRFEESQLDGPGAAAAASEAELAEFHARHAERYTAPEQVHAALIQLPLPPPAAAARHDGALAHAQEIRRAALAAPDAAAAFAALAREHSRHAGSRRGSGDLGWLTRSSAGQFLPAEVVAEYFAPKEPGAVSPVIATAEGVFLVQVLGRRPAQVRSLDEVRERVRQDLARARAAAAEAALFARLRDDHPVEINTARLAELAPPPATLASRPPRLPAP